MLFRTYRFAFGVVTLVLLGACSASPGGTSGNGTGGNASGGASGGSGGSGGTGGFGGYCLAEGTLVATPSGPVPIERLEVGDLVLGYDLEAKRVRANPVLSVRDSMRNVGVFRGGRGETIYATGEHPFYDARRGEFVPLSEIGDGPLALVLDDFRSPERLFEGEPGASVGLSIGFEELGREARVFDIGVARDHNYFAEGVLVHNKQPPCLDPCGCYGAFDCPPEPACVATIALGTCEPAKASLVSSGEGYLLEGSSMGGMGGSVESGELEQRLVVGVSGECSAVGLSSSMATKVAITGATADACGYGDAIFVGNLNDLGSLPLGTYFMDVEFAASEPVVLSFGPPGIEK